MTENKLHFFTIVARNYLAYAYVLGESIKLYHPEAQFSVFVMDDVDAEFSQEIASKGFNAISPDEIPLTTYATLVFKYNVTEASTAVKPFVVKCLFSQGYEQVVYLDPDIQCYRRFTEVLQILEQNSIVLTPHNTLPIPDDVFPDDDLYLTCGVYNLGFVAIRNDEPGRKFVDWWCRRLDQHCLDAREMGLFVDQKWVDLVPAYFDSVVILKSLAYNAAYWNVHLRRVVRLDGRWRVLPSNEDLAFFHFSGIRIEDPTKVTKYGPRGPLSFGREKRRVTFDEQTDLAVLYAEYADAVRRAGYEYYTTLSYAYGAYANGEAISQLERVLLLVSPEWQNAGSDPFAVTDSSFWRCCRKAGIRAASSKTISTADRPLQSGQNRVYDIAFGFIRLLIRLILLLAGPVLYSKFAKYVRQQLLLVNHGFLIGHNDKRL